MGLEQLSTFQKFLAIGKWAGLASLLLLVIINLIGVIIIGFQTGNWNPTLDATLGKLIASDNDIKYATQQLIDNPNLPPLYVNTLKESIIYSIGFIILVHYLLFLAIKWLFKVGNSVDLSTLNFVVILFIVILLLISVQLVYNGVARNEWNWVPYKGMTLLVQNYQVFSITGDNTWTLAHGVPNLLNQTIQNA